MKIYEELSVEEKAFLWVQLNRHEKPDIIVNIPHDSIRSLMGIIVDDIGQKEVAKSWHVNVSGSDNNKFEDWWRGGGRKSWCRGR